MSKELWLQMLEAAHDQVVCSIKQEKPGEGLTLVMDLSNPTCRLLAVETGASSSDIDKLLLAAKEVGAVPWNVCWIGANDAIKLVATQGKEQATAIERLLNEAERKRQHAVASFLANNRIHLCLMSANGKLT